ncbi:hypothetical protein P4T89_20505, partial [Bacillus nakamurai]|nr:hypothetical protein [Bacillus nakamurai]
FWLILMRRILFLVFSSLTINSPFIYVADFRGFDYAFPSRSDKKHSISVQSKLRSLESYSKPIDDSNELFLNIVEVSTTANSVTSQQVLIVQTKMKKEKNKWLVDNVQVKGNG